MCVLLHVNKFGASEKKFFQKKKMIKYEVSDERD